jgi:hypothetical protein
VEGVGVVVEEGLRVGGGFEFLAGDEAVLVGVDLVKDLP